MGSRTKWCVGVALAVGLVVATTALTVRVAVPDPAQPEVSGVEGDVVGRVIDEEGMPVPGVTVWSYAGASPPRAVLPGDELVARLAESGERPVTTDEQGRYRRPVDRAAVGGAILAFQPPDASYAWAFGGSAVHPQDVDVLALRPRRAVEHDVVVRRAGSLSGRVTHDGDAAAPMPAGWWIEAVRISRGPNGTWSRRLLAHAPLTSSSWRLDGLPPGTYEVRAWSRATGKIHHPGTARGPRTTVEVVGWKHRGGVDIALRTSAVLRGTVRDPEGRPLADVDVVVARATSPTTGVEVAARATTDGRGRYRVQLPTGRYDVHLHDEPGTCRSVDTGRVRVAAGGQVRHDVTAPRPSYVSGTITLPDGLDRVRLDVETTPAVAPSEPSCNVWLGERAAGRFVVRGLPAGTYALLLTDTQSFEALPTRSTGAHQHRRFSVRGGAVLTGLDVTVGR